MYLYINNLSKNMESILDLIKFIKERKLWWLMPVIFALIVLGVLIVIAESSAVGSFIYTLF